MLRERPSHAHSGHTSGRLTCHRPFVSFLLSLADLRVELGDLTPQILFCSYETEKPWLLRP